MNKSMFIGVVAGVAVATAGGVAGYTFLGQPPEQPEDTVAMVDEASGSTVTQGAASASQPRQASAQASAPAPVVQEECWDEEVTVQADPKDDHAIAGTAAGAVIGGALAKEIGDDNDLATAAGAAAGAFLGRRAQKQMQENNTTTTVERRCAPAGSR